VESIRPLVDDDASLAAFPAVPAAWYYVGRSAELAAGPVRFELPGGQSFVAFRPAPESLAMLDARCSHMGADLSRGCVKDGRIVCPLHGWQYGAHGRCEHLPAATEIPPRARQTAFPIEERGGHVFFFNRPEPRFPLPFFAGLKDQQLLAARSCEFIVEAPWHLVAANGFDVQHFRCAHDRTLIDEPVVDSPDRFAWRMRAKFRVTGRSLLDRLTRWLSGSEFDMTVENWGGAFVLVTSRARRTVTHGMVSFIPLDDRRTRVRNIIWIPRRRSWLGRRFVDPLDAAIRRIFIREFLRSDAERSAGMRFHPDRMIAADKVLVAYLEWLQKILR
jgi:phenylpropionate dioxygenase-like ring-hydroxylating dioxygenase large terminal subunit